MNWEAELRKLGMPSDLPSEGEKAAKAGVEVLAWDTINPEFKALEAKLKLEDPSNFFGGFPTSMETMVSLVETLREEWISNGVSPDGIHVNIHDSCMNDNDCIVVSYINGNKYHYNTQNIRGYSREKTIKLFENHKITCGEK